MRTVRLSAVVLIAALSGAATLAQGARAGVMVFEGARIIDGNGGPPITNGALVVQDGRLVAVGAREAVQVPAGATRVDVSGKTIMPAMINVHVHMGYEGYTTWGARNHTPREPARSPAARSVLRRRGRDRRSAPARRRCRSSSSAISRPASFRPASRFLFMPGMAPPNGGPDAVLRVATNELHVVNEVTTAAEARAAVQRMAASKHPARQDVGGRSRRHATRS